MALVVADRVQETTTTSGTGTLSLGGAVAGYQTFVSGIGSGNTTFYTIYDQTAQVWEVGIGTVTSGSPNTLSRTTVLSNSSGNTSPLSLAGNSANVFCTYPAEKSVNLNASGNVGPLGTISSAVWQASTIAVAYGGTGVTTSSGANSVVLRDSNVNVSANNFFPGYTPTVSAGTTTSLSASSTYIQRLTGTTTQTYQLPDATTLPTGAAFIFDNDSSGTLTIVDHASGAVDTVPSGGIDFVYLLANGTTAGTWQPYAFVPGSYDFSASTASFGGATITNATWNGNPIPYNYGGTTLTTFGAANNALYSTSASALTYGTLPVAAGGSGATTLTGYVYGNGTSPFTASTTIPGSAISGSVSSATNVAGGAANQIVYQTGSGTSSFITAPSTGSTYLQWTGSAFTWASISAGVTTFQTNLSGLTPSTATSGAVTLSGTLGVASGGTGLTSLTSGYIPYGNGTSAFNSSSSLTYTSSTGVLSAPEVAASNGLILNATTVSTSFTIPSGQNAYSVGPVTVASGVTVTITSGQRWLVA